TGPRLRFYSQALLPRRRQNPPATIQRKNEADHRSCCKRGDPGQGHWRSQEVLTLSGFDHLFTNNEIVNPMHNTTASTPLTLETSDGGPFGRGTPESGTTIRFMKR